MDRSSVPSPAQPRATADVRIPLSGGTSLPAALALPSGAGPRPGVLVIHEALGLNDEMRRIAARFAANGYAALAPDFMAGLGPMPLCIARFMRGIRQVGRGRPYRQLDAARAWLAGHAGVDGGRIGVAGFCMGGGFAILYAAGAAGDGLRVVAPFYGPVPDDPERSLTGICPVVASFGARDGAFGRMAAPLEQALETLGVEHDVKVYPDAGHAFMTRTEGVIGWLGRRLPTHVGYHEPSAEDAWARTLAFFGRYLPTPEATG